MMIASDGGAVRRHTPAPPPAPEAHTGKGGAPSPAAPAAPQAPQNPPGKTLARMAREQREPGASAALGGTAGARAARAHAQPSHASADAAARAALDRANPLSVQDNLEYGGKVFHDPETGRYTASWPRSGTDQGFDPSAVREPKGKQLAGDYHTHGDYSEVGPNREAVRTSDPQRDHFDSDRFSVQDRSGIRLDAVGRPGYAGYLGTPSGDYRRFDPAARTQADTVFARQPSTTSAAASAHAGGAGAVVGATIEAGLSTGRALSDGRLSAREARDITADTARGAAIGSTYAVTEHGLVRATDRATGVGIEHLAARAASRAGAADAGAVGALARAGATRLAGAGAAGAVVGAGLSIYEHRDALARGDSQAIGEVAGDTVVGASAALAGAAAGATIGSAVPVLGTAVGAVVGLGVGAATDYVLHAGGVDKAVGQAVSGGVDAAKNAAHTVAGWFGG